MSPLSSALRAYHAGDLSAAFIIRRDDGFERRIPASAFFADGELPPIEAQALALCRGRILDVGTGAGRHSLNLIRRGYVVTSLEVLPEMEAILHDRGVRRVVISDLFAFNGESFDTLLLLMNGIGMVGTLEGLNRFLHHAHRIVEPNGQILCDSVDVSMTNDPVHVAYRRRNVERGRPPGQQTFTMIHQALTGDEFHWLHVDFGSLAEHCRGAGWLAELIAQKPNGHYLCRLSKI